MREGSKTEEVFEMLLRGIDVLATTFDDPRGILKYGYDDLMQIKNAKSRRERQQALRRLEQQKLIKIQKKGDKIYFALTDEGKYESLKRVILGKQSKLPKGQVCVVTFDIPEKVRHVRDALRMMLAGAGFKQVHKSVWEGDGDVVEELRLFVKKLKAEKWIIIYKSERIN